LKKVGQGVGIAGREVVEIVKKMSDSEFVEFVGKVGDPVKKSIIQTYKKSYPLSRIIKQAPENIRFSQNSVNDFNSVYKNMLGSKQWTGKPIDTVKMSDGVATTIDNTRLLAAKKAGVMPEVVIRSFDEAIDPNLAKRFPNKKNEFPKTWGEAINNRIQKQIGGFGTNNPNGNFADPIIK